MPEFRLRLQAKAGLTGYAQVYGKYNTTPYDKLQMDLMYIAHPGLAEDFRIILATVKGDIHDIGKNIVKVLLENYGYEVLDLGFGRCRFALVVKRGCDFYGTYKTRRVASKYPNVTRAFFEGKGMDVDIIKIEGSVELAPILDLANGIVDIVETGATLKENGLEPIEDVAQVSARLIVNTASMKLYKNEITDFLSRVERELGGRA